MNFPSTLSASQQWHLNRANHATNTDPEYIVKDPEQEIWVNQKSGRAMLFFVVVVVVVFFFLFLRPPLLSLAHCGMGCKISSPCQMLMTQLSLTVKTDEVTGGEG